MGRESAVAIHSSPRRRTRETAAAIGAEMGIDEEVAFELDEIDFGVDWCGRAFDDLNTDARWRQWNEARSTARTPAGEALSDVQRRIVGHMEHMRKNGAADR